MKSIQKKPVGGEEQLLNVVKAAKLLGIKRSDLRELAYRGRIPGLIIGGSLFFRLSHIEAFVNKMRKSPSEFTTALRLESL
jgi:hypothetical protein